jgi:DNA-binding NtrC family response regulator
MKKRRDILIVDDEKDLCNILCKLLTFAGYSVDSVNNGMESVKKAQKVAYQIIFMDVMLPDINGLEAFLKIKKISPESITVMMTGYAEKNLIKKAITKGAYCCIYKPFNISEILAVIEKIFHPRE